MWHVHAGRHPCWPKGNVSITATHDAPRHWSALPTEEHRPFLVCWPRLLSATLCCCLLHAVTRRVREHASLQLAGRVLCCSGTMAEALTGVPWQAGRAGCCRCHHCSVGSAGPARAVLVEEYGVMRCYKDAEGIQGLQRLRSHMHSQMRNTCGSPTHMKRTILLGRMAR